MDVSELPGKNKRKKRVLMLASVASMIAQFNMENIRLLLELGYEVDVACNFEKGNTCLQKQIEELQGNLSEMGVRCYQIDFERGIRSAKSILLAYHRICMLIVFNDYACIHCHSPIGGVIGRLAAKKQGRRVIYTAHGFHFFKGGPLQSWLFFYPMEKLLAGYTDVLITINREDYLLARKHFHAKRVEKIPGAGIDAAYFSAKRGCRERYRESLGLKQDDFVIISAGELCSRKNHQVIIRAVYRIQDPRVKYVIAGHGSGRRKLARLAETLGLADRIRFLDYRTDLPELFQMADVFAFPSKREGLGLAAIEAMAAGLPVISSNVNGINDYSKDYVTGFVCAPDDAAGFAAAVRKCMKHPAWCARTGRANQRRAQKYDMAKVREKMRDIYESI